MNFYCQKECGEVGFSIDEWNKAFQYCIDNNLSKEQTNKVLYGEPCSIQCFDCMAIVGERRCKTKKLLNIKTPKEMKDQVFKVNKVVGYLNETDHGELKEIKGVVETPYGFVNVSSTEYIHNLSGKVYPFTTISYIQNGHEVTRNWDKYYTSVGLSRLAGKLAKEYHEKFSKK